MHYSYYVIIVDSRTIYRGTRYRMTCIGVIYAWLLPLAVQPGAALKKQKLSKTKPRNRAPKRTDDGCISGSFRTAPTYSLDSFTIRGVGRLLARVGRRYYPTEAEFHEMHLMDSGMSQLRTTQYHRPREVHVGLPFMVPTSGFVSGTKRTPTRQPHAGTPR